MIFFLLQFLRCFNYIYMYKKCIIMSDFDRSKHFHFKSLLKFDVVGICENTMLSYNVLETTYNK